MAKRIIASVFAFVLMMTVVCSCGNGGGQTVSTTAGIETAGNTDDGKYHAAIPDRKYDGATFTIMCRSLDSSWNDRTLIGESDDETVLGAANWKRNSAVEAQLGIKLEFAQIATTPTGGAFYNVIQENSLTYDYICDVAVQSVYDACNLIPTGIIKNLDDVPYVNLNQPWWQQKLNDSLALLGKHYFAINHMLVNDKLDTYALFFNKDNFDDNGLVYPYKYVEEGTWTVERLKKMITDFGWDLNQNNKKDYQDQFGMAYQRIDSFFTGFGLLGATLDKDGYPEMNEFSDRVQKAYDAMYALRNNYDWNEWGYWDDGHTDNVTQLYVDLYYDVLFVCGPLSHYIDTIPLVENNIGVVPSPWLDENQNEYFGRAGLSGTTAVTVLNSVPDIERAGIVIEALGAEGLNITYPAFYETLLQDRYSQDEESKKMISIIIESEVIDLDALFVWGNMNRQLELNIASKNPAAASVYAKYLDGAKGKLDETMAGIIKNLNSKS